MLAEEATGTWCTWCPRGAVFMAKMKEDYPDDFIGIAVHNQDPMTLTSYNTGLTNLPGFSGFPSVVVRRQILSILKKCQNILQKLQVEKLHLLS